MNVTYSTSIVGVRIIKLFSSTKKTGVIAGVIDMAISDVVESGSL